MKPSDGRLTRWEGDPAGGRGPLDAFLSRLPPRAEEILSVERRAGEITIGWVQASVVMFAGTLYGLSPQAWNSMASFEPVPVVLAAYLVFTLSRLVLAYRFDLPAVVLGTFTVADFALLYGLIWSYHLQYDQPPGFYLKAPTLLYAFIFIILRGLRFDPLAVLFAGVVGATGWAALTLFAVFSEAPSQITRSFVEHMTSNAVLIGAEIERINAILIATAVTTLVVIRSRRHLVAAALGRTAATDLSRFFSPGIVERILETQTLQAGVGELRQATILVTDIRGFTALTTAMNPNDIIAFLSTYQRDMGRIIREEGGTIDKFLGDGILATFGCLGDRPHPAADALRTAVALAKEAESWGNNSGVRIGVALASGPVVFGTVGDGARLEYTVIGEPVNVATKLEKHNKEVGCVAIVDRATFDKAVEEGFKPPERARMLKNQNVGGIKEPMELVALY